MSKIWHGSLQERTAEFDPSKQHEGGWSPTFSILAKDENVAAVLPYRLKLFTVCRFFLKGIKVADRISFQHATSLGGVESLIEHRRLSDPKTDPRLLRISVGIEDVEVRARFSGHDRETHRLHHRISRKTLDKHLEPLLIETSTRRNVEKETCTVGFPDQECWCNQPLFVHRSLFKPGGCSW